MKRFWIALFALALVFAFVAPSYATDVNFTGYYRVRGFWDYNRALAPDNIDVNNNTNDAYYDQRLRVLMNFNVAEGLSITARFHAMDRVWGEDAVSSGNNGTLDKNNIYWNRAYATWKSPVGKFDVGYMSGGTFGTVFADTEADGVPRIKYTGAFGPWIILALTEKGVEQDGIGVQDVSDADYDKYAIAPFYKWDGGIVGALWFYLPNHANKPAAVGTTESTSLSNLFVVYTKTTLGPVYLEAEVDYFTSTTEFEGADAGRADIDRKGWSWYLYGKYNMGPAYVGFQYGYVAGDDSPNDPNDSSAGYTGSDWNPCLILFNDNIANRGTYEVSGAAIVNSSLYQIFGGFSPMANLDLWAAFTYAVVDEQDDLVDDEIGYEFDIQATYKILDNLEYQLGFGYLAAGDAYKGNDATNQVDDNWLLMHKLQLNF